MSASVKSLKAATTYHYRLVAQNSSGRSFGADRSFSTVGPPSVQTQSAQSVGPDVGAVTGSLDTRGRSTTWWFDYGTSIIITSGNSFTVDLDQTGGLFTLA